MHQIFGTPPPSGGDFAQILAFVASSFSFLFVLHSMFLAIATFLPRPLHTMLLIR